MKEVVLLLVAMCFVGCSTFRKPDPEVIRAQSQATQNALAGQTYTNDGAGTQSGFEHILYDETGTKVIGQVEMGLTMLADHTSKDLSLTLNARDGLTYSKGEGIVASASQTDAYYNKRSDIIKSQADALVSATEAKYKGKETMIKAGTGFVTGVLEKVEPLVNPILGTVKMIGTVVKPDGGKESGEILQ